MILDSALWAFSGMDFLKGLTKLVTYGSLISNASWTFLVGLVQATFLAFYTHMLVHGIIDGLAGGRGRGDATIRPHWGRLPLGFDLVTRHLEIALDLCEGVCAFKVGPWHAIRLCRALGLSYNIAVLPWDNLTICKYVERFSCRFCWL